MISERRDYKKTAYVFLKRVCDAWVQLLSLPNIKYNKYVLNIHRLSGSKGVTLVFKKMGLKMSYYVTYFVSLEPSLSIYIFIHI